MEYGYIRVSTKEQNEDRQFFAMKEFGIDSKDLYMDKLSLSKTSLWSYGFSTMLN